MIDNVFEGVYSHAELWGQKVPLVKAIVSPDGEKKQGDNKHMAMRKKSDFEKELKARLVLARKAAGLTQQDVADALGIPLDRYKKYENRPNSLPPLDTFAALCDVLHHDPSYFLYGPIKKNATRRTAHPAS